MPKKKKEPATTKAAPASLGSRADESEVAILESKVKKYKGTPQGEEYVAKLKGL